MLLTSGNYYRIADGRVVKVQEEAGGIISAYDVSGERVHQCEVDDHVNGWEPVGVNDWNKAREAHKQEKAKARKPAKKKERKDGKGKKE